MVIKNRPARRPFECPVQFTKDYEAFKEICISREYSPMRKTVVFSILQKFYRRL
ncbi:MAG: hypothetical protein KJ770_05060 [Actinobacteria bacterium]|nr:hypothetical protein [Actinomycetota bacterium]